MLIEAHTDIRRFNLDQFREWIEQTATNRNSTTIGGLKLWQLLPGVLTGGIDTRPSLIHDDIGDVVLLKITNYQLSEQGLNLATRCAIPNRNDVAVVLTHQFNDPGGCRLPLLWLADDVQDVMGFGDTTGIYHNCLAATFKTRVNGEHRFTGNGWLQQEIPQISREDLNGMLFRYFRHFPTNLAFQARQD